MDRSSVKGKRILHGKVFGYIGRRLSVGLPEDLDKFLTAQSEETKIAKAEIIRNLISQKMKSVYPITGTSENAHAS